MKQVKQDAARNKAVEDALFLKATGQRYQQQEAYKVKRAFYDENGKKVEEESIEIVTVDKQTLPDFSAIALWLKTQQPQRWGEVPATGLLPAVHIIDDIPACNDTKMLGLPEAGGAARAVCEGDYNNMQKLRNATEKQKTEKIGMQTAKEQTVLYHNRADKTVEKMMMPVAGIACGENALPVKHVEAEPKSRTRRKEKTCDVTGKQL